ncbi:MAG: fused MFS/spermidine synthase [Desulfuromonadales bacterium]|nr:fused MFS/spermidine synthase [Desulfuromonadales bacterium]
MKYYFICFLTGMVILILEVLGFRLFAPYFGSSVYVSGSQIGVILAALSLGYFIGGQWADKKPDEKLIYYAIVLSAIYLAVIRVLQEPILHNFQSYSIYGALFSSLIFFGLPMVLLSTVSPFFVKLLSMKENVGKTAGNIFSVSTVGSIVGSFLVTFFLIPEIGSSSTFTLSIAILLILGVLGLTLITKRHIALGTLLALLLIPPIQVQEKNLIFKGESVYNTVRLYKDKRIIWMTLNQSQYRQSFGSTNETEYLTYRTLFSMAPYITKVNKALILGMSAGASVLDLEKHFDFHIDAVEIDPLVVDLAKEHFGIKEKDNLKIHVTDARNYLKQSGQYDFIEIDLFHGGPEVPFHTVTEEFFTTVRQRLTAEGIVMMNLVGNLSNLDFVTRPILNTVSKEFPSVYYYQDDSNIVMLATNNNSELEDIRASLSKAKHYPIMAKKYAENLQRFQHNPEGLIFTDDHAPIEKLNKKLLEAYASLH